MSREVQAIVLILLGSAVTRISMTDIYLRYVKESLRPFLLGTGVLLLVLGFWALWDIIRASRSHADSHSHSSTHGDESAVARPGDSADSVVAHTGDGATPVGAAAFAANDDIGAELHDGHDHGQMRIAWLLLLPVLSILLIAPPALGAYSATRENATVLPPAVSFDPLPAGDPVELTLGEYAVRAVWDDQQSLAGRNITMEGFVTPIPDGQVPSGLPGTTHPTWWLTRLSLACCAADALVTKILTLGTTPLPANTWVRVEGKWVPGGPTNDDNAIPWFEITSIRKIPEPANPYE